MQRRRRRCNNYYVQLHDWTKRVPWPQCDNFTFALSFDRYRGNLTNTLVSTTAPRKLWLNASRDHMSMKSKPKKIRYAIRYFCDKVNIWNVNCAWVTAFIFDSRTDAFVKGAEDFEKMSRLQGDLNPQPSDSRRILYLFELSGPDICCPMLLNSGFGGINIFAVKLTFDMLSVRGQQHSFLTHERMFLWKENEVCHRK